MLAVGGPSGQLVDLVLPSTCISFTWHPVPMRGWPSCVSGLRKEWLTPMKICRRQTETAYYFFPPEILPRLASRGIIEVETASTTFFRMCVEPHGCHQSACATYLSLLIQTVGKRCRDVESPIQPVIQPVGKHGTAIQTVNI